ncbi:murein biosynthesis integral membrane protein MurJ [Candidatus Daviesbacteria bacterium]|nr:murein biosynthesis integral membrane protein MurJ [Candidatus Daviesbacteria bacterium]
MVKSFLSILAARQNSILSGAMVLMVAIFASKFLGLIKDRLLFHNFDTTQSAIFFAAFKLPDLIFQLLIFGSLSVAFIPIFTEYLHQKGPRQAFEFASNILNLSLLVFGLVALIAFIFVVPLNSLLIPGFSGHQKEVTDQLTKIILLSQLFLIIGSFFIAVGQSYQRFIVPALAPFFYNVGIILGITVLSQFFGIYGPAFGVLIGAVLHVLIQVPLIKSLGFKYQLSFDFLNKGVKEIFRLMSIRNIGLIAEQINDVVAIALSSVISYSSVSLLTVAQHLQTAPIGLFGATIAQAALPVLSREQSRNESPAFKITLLTTMHQILFLVLPVSAILIILRIPLVRLVFGAARFSWEDTVLTGWTVAFLSLGLVSQSVVLLLVRAFYALKDTKTPVIVSIISVAVNILLSLLFINVMHLPVWGLGISYSVSSNLSLVLLFSFLHKRVGGFNLYSLLMPAFKMLVSAAVAAVALYIPIKQLDQLVFDTTRTVNLIILTVIASCFGLIVYIILVWLLKIKELYTYAELVKKIGRTKLKVTPKEVVGET